MIAFLVPDMTSSLGAGAVTRAIKSADRAAVVRIDLKTRTVEIEPVRTTAKQLSEAIAQAGYTPEAA